MKKNPFLFINVHVLYVLELKINKNISSVCMYVCPWVPSGDTINFEGVSVKQNLVGVFYV